MDRSVIYTQEQGRSTDILFAQRSTMIGLGKLAKAVLGAQTVVDGLAVTPVSPAALSVQVGIGAIYSLQPVDATAYGVLPADTADTIIKQGLLMAAQQLSCPAPATAGYSINYLIEVTYQDQDTNLQVLPYFNSANPSQPLSGQNNSGAAQATQRQGFAVVQAKAGAAATTGTQTTPAADSGYTGLAVVTVANGQATITSSNIALVSGAPTISSVLQAAQSAGLVTGNDTGAANAYVMAVNPPIAAYAGGMTLNLEGIVATNTGASTISVSGLTAIPIIGPAGVALQGGELVATYGAILRINKAATAAELVYSSGGPNQIAPASKTGQSTNLGQLFIGNRKAVFTANGTYTVPPSVTQIWVSGCAGAGGGGGGGGSVGSTGNAGSGGGGGGGAGQPTIRQAISVTGGHTLSIAIGAAGTGGAAGANTGTAGSNGTTGGNTSLTDSTSATTLLTLNGGTGGTGGAGQASTTVGIPDGAGGGLPGSGYPNGSNGSDGNYTGNGGAGASSPFGGGGGSGRAGTGPGGGTSASSASGYGSGGGGGGGAYAGIAGAGGAGGAGAGGYFVIEW